MTHTIRKLAAALVLVLLAPLAFAQGGVAPAMFTPFKKGGGSISSGSSASGCTAYSLVYIDSAGNLACAQAAQNSNVSTAGNGITQINATMSGSLSTANFFNVTGTFPSGSYTSAQLIAPILFNVAGGGGTAVSADTAAIRLKYDTGTPNINAGGFGNFGILSDATLRGNTGWGSTGAYTSSAVAGRATVTTGTEIVAGVWGTAAGSGNTRNFGVLGEGISGGALSIGVVGRGANSTNNIGGYFTLGSAVPTGTTVALVAENSSVAANIFEARDNGTAQFTIQDSGSVLMLQPLNNNGGGIYAFGSGGFGFASGGGSATTPLIRIETALTPDALTFNSDSTSNSFHFSERSDIGFDFANGACGTAACTDPSLIIHSAVQDATQYNHQAAWGQAGGALKTLTESAATSVIQIPIANLAGAFGEFCYTVKAADATDSQIRGSCIKYTVTAKAGTETCSLNTQAALTSDASITETEDGSGSGAITTGTLTYAITCSTTPSNAVDIQINAVSSLTQTTLNVTYKVNHVGPGQPARQ